MGVLEDTMKWTFVNTLLHDACKLEHQEIQIAFKPRAEALLF